MKVTTNKTAGMTRSTQIKSKLVPKDGPSAECIAAHNFYLHSSVKTMPRTPIIDETPQIPDTEDKDPPKTRAVQTPKDAPETIEPTLPKGKLVATTHRVTTHTV